jgi:hypothetical protein
MRASTATSFISAGLAAIALLGCANRGMRAPDDGGPGAAGASGTAGSGGTTGTGGRGGSGGSAGTGGSPTGTAGRGGSGGQTSGTGGCTLAPGAEMPGGACNAMFNFETDAEGAAINAGSTAFITAMKAGASTYCGTGALAINAFFSGTSGPSTKGEVLIALPGAPVDLTGKTITVHVAADPGCSADLNLSVVLNTQAGPVYFTPAFPIRPVNNTWKTGTATVGAGATAALALSLQAFSSTNYQGTIYVDEIDIR